MPRKLTTTICLALTVLLLSDLKAQSPVAGSLDDYYADDDKGSNVKQTGYSNLVQCQCGCNCKPVEGSCCPECGRALPSSEPSRMAPIYTPDGTLVSPPSMNDSVPVVPPVLGEQTSPAPQPPSPTPQPPSPQPPTPTPSPQPTPPSPSANDFAGFSPQASVSAASAFAAAPSTIGDTFGGGGVSITTIFEEQTFTAFGDIVAGNPLGGDANADLSFDLVIPDFVPEFFSVGSGRDERPDVNNGIDTFDVEEVVPGSTLIAPSGSTLDSTTATRVAGPGPYVNGEDWTITARFARRIEVPNPSAIVVGRMSIAENSSPLPRNRVFVNYSYFNSVRLRPEGVDVHRFSPGFEVMLSDKASFEIRTPFASTLSSSFTLDGATTTGTEFGDIFFAVKQILAQTENTLWTLGLGITLPTADDLNIGLSNGNELIRVENQTFHLQPFIGYMLMLTDKLFAQGFVQLDLDALGNDVFINPNSNAAEKLVFAGTVRDTTTLRYDLSLGYWLRKQGEHRGKTLTSIVPMAEYHFSRSLDNNETVSLNNVTIGQSGNGVQRNTAVAGCHFGVCNNHQITLGYAIPIGNGADQQFNSEVRAFWNRQF